MAVEELEPGSPQANEMLPELGGINQHKRFDIIKVLQNVILELQTEIAKHSLAKEAARKPLMTSGQNY